MKILHFRPSHIDTVLSLNLEFEQYLQSLSSGQREDFNIEKKRKMFLDHAFGKKKSFSGYVAKIDGEIVGYVLYHFGFDPDEMG
jgi:hypothetical protein